MDFIKVGEWVLNVDDVAAVHYVETRDGPVVAVYTHSAADPVAGQRGGFRAEGEEAVHLWAWFTSKSQDLLAPTRTQKTTPRPPTRGTPRPDLVRDADLDALLRHVTAGAGPDGHGGA
jgi:hypothetical protein